MKRTVASILAASLLGMSLVGCGSGEGSEKAAADQPQNDEVVEINYLTWRSRPGTHPENLIAEFEKQNPNIKVIPQVVKDNDQFQQAQQMRLLGGTEIDVTSVTPSNLKTLVEEGYLVSLDGEPYLENYVPGTLDSATVDGKVYGVPGAINIIGVIYNKTMFDQLGIEIPKTFSEFEDACEKIKAAGITPLINGEKESWQVEMDTYPFFHDLMLQDSEIFDKANTGEVKYTDPIFQDMFAQIEAFYKKGYLHPDILSLNGSDALQLFVTGQAAMMIHGEWAAQPLDEAKPDFEVGVFQVPPIHATVSKAPVTVSNFECLVSSSKHPEEAKKFLEFVSEKEGATMVMNGLSAFSAVKGVQMEGETYLNLFSPLLEGESVDFFYSRQNPADNSEMLKLLQELQLGMITSTELCEELQAFHDANVT